MRRERPWLAELDDETVQTAEAATNDIPHILPPRLAREGLADHLDTLTDEDLRGVLTAAGLRPTEVLRDGWLWPWKPGDETWERQGGWLATTRHGGEYLVWSPTRSSGYLAKVPTRRDREELLAVLVWAEQAEKPEPRKIGWYSAQAAALFGTAVHRHEDGREVHVTAVCQAGDEGNYNWPDKVRVGPVTEYVGKGRRPDTVTIGGVDLASEAITGVDYGEDRGTKTTVRDGFEIIDRGRDGVRLRPLHESDPARAGVCACDDCNRKARESAGRSLAAFAKVRLGGCVEDGCSGRHTDGQRCDEHREWLPYQREGSKAPLESSGTRSEWLYERLAAAARGWAAPLLPSRNPWPDDYDLLPDWPTDDRGYAVPEALPSAEEVGR